MTAGDGPLGDRPLRQSHHEAHVSPPGWESRHEERELPTLSLHCLACCDSLHLWGKAPGVRVPSQWDGSLVASFTPGASFGQSCLCNALPTGTLSSGRLSAGGLEVLSTNRVMILQACLTDCVCEEASPLFSSSLSAFVAPAFHSLVVKGDRKPSRCAGISGTCIR